MREECGSDKTTQEVRLGGTLVPFEQDSGKHFKAEARLHSESYSSIGRSQSALNRVWVGVSGKELSCPSMERLVWCGSQQASHSARAEPLSSWHVAYICPLPRFERQTTVGKFKGGFLCARAKLPFAAASQLPSRSDL